jgi:hypothetical protein
VLDKVGGTELVHDLESERHCLRSSPSHGRSTASSPEDRRPTSKRLVHG